MAFHLGILYFIQTASAIAVGIACTRFLLPLKKGFREENQKLITQGMIYLLITIFGIALIVYCGVGVS
ncbi:hypothetical protein [Candidatus Neptunochlamydia vexilliferae]|uniref:Uncharacterized protein n=1 Tax=Candidatus Neptunichlamydia vexilliferae TaxID=1651774 RepID=A0ABS0AZN4_9BACT|nr:hypothetical protein [Candidatus Neptunochlamydia vexilliferae]MBF5059594.1 hypothetical protein [Candidatus Neptunochlamydia vexilliferae]